MSKFAQSLSIKMLRKKLKLDAPNLQNSESIATVSPSQSMDLPKTFLELEINLNESLKKVSFSHPVEYVYHPLDYALKPHTVFVNRYCTSHKKVMFLGINPGPWGMCQTGIPFGEVASVRDWFKINEDVSKPERECPERKVLGLACKRSEISGQRVWRLFKNICGTPENFFKSGFMYNYCPIALMKKGGSNVTPSEIKGDAQKLEELCDETLYDVIQLLQVEIVVGFGRYAEARALHVLEKSNPLNTKVFYLVHPSPRVPNNKNWEFMNTAFKFAHEALASQEVPVGCIFVHNGEIVATGRNTVNATRNATRHAELNCIDDVNQICKSQNCDVLTFFSAVEVYVTVEPCIMCAAALYDLNVRCIVYGCKNDRFGGETVFNVASVLKPVTRCIGGFRADEAMSLLKTFYKGTNPSAPPHKVKLKNKEN
ncbi:hypothetical protein RI129_003842 [Pyrocoelia pectoralis]|uniref:CMP/dCMP-type deaminase domain-containing protein n=1 Tax=Pyrocoelia pectoralis TaxID=417401 RepID=A0AAN7ZIY3_9COLE